MRKIRGGEGGGKLDPGKLYDVWAGRSSGVGSGKHDSKDSSLC